MDTGKSALGLDGNLAAALGYPIGIIAIISLIMEKENRFVKFHALQSILLHVLAIVVMIALWILILGLRFILLIVFLILWIMGGIKAYGGQWYKLPIIGEFAWKTVNK